MDKVARFKADLETALQEVHAVLKDWEVSHWKVTLVVRNPPKPLQYVVLSIDRLKEVARLLQSLESPAETPDRLSLLETIADKAAEVDRLAQKYYRTRTPSDLNASKIAEAELRDLLKMRETGKKIKQEELAL